MKKCILMIILSLIVFTNCIATENVEGVNVEIDRMFAGFWVAEFYTNKSLRFWDTSWGKIQGSKNGVLVDFKANEEQILSVDGGIFVHRVELIDKNTLKMKVRVAWAEKDDDSYDYLIMHVLDDPQYMWIETEGAAEGGGQIFASEGPKRILKKAAGPGMPIPPIREDEWIYDAP